MNEQLLEDKARLLEAVNKAALPSACVYVYGGKPACVIAQLAVIENIGTDTLQGWDARKEQTPGNQIMHLATDDVFAELLTHKYGEDLLRELQYTWDCDLYETKVKRSLMRDMVEKAYAFRSVTS